MLSRGRGRVGVPAGPSRSLSGQRPRSMRPSPSKGDPMVLKTSGIALGKSGCLVQADRAGRHQCSRHLPANCDAGSVDTTTPPIWPICQAKPWVLKGPTSSARPAAGVDECDLRPRLQRDEELGGVKHRTDNRTIRHREVLDAREYQPSVARSSAPNLGGEGIGTAENARLFALLTWRWRTPSSTIGMRNSPITSGGR